MKNADDSSNESDRSSDLEWNKDVDFDVMDGDMGKMLRRLKARLAEVAEQIDDGSVG